MFTVYKKLITPETSPVLGPAITPRESPNLMPKDGNLNSPAVTALNSATNDLTTALVMEPFSLCNYCCSPRNKMKKDSSTTDPPDSENPTQKYPIQDQIQIRPEFEFGHATHYKYNVITPRLICEFETGTPP